MNKQFLIDALEDTFARRCKYLTSIEDYDSAASLYEEWVVDGVDPQNGEYEWIFIPNLTSTQ
jgi:hypothetical protein